MNPNVLFSDLNRQFFESQLPRYRVELSKTARWPGEWQPERRLIRLRKGLDPKELRKELAHQMCHIAASDYEHGKEFEAKLRALAARGEQWASGKCQFAGPHCDGD